MMLESEGEIRAGNSRRTGVEPVRERHHSEERVVRSTLRCYHMIRRKVKKITLI